MKLNPGLEKSKILEKVSTQSISCLWLSKQSNWRWITIYEMPRCWLFWFLSRRLLGRMTEKWGGEWPRYRRARAKHKSLHCWSLTTSWTIGPTADDSSTSSQVLVSWPKPMSWKWSGSTMSSKSGWRTTAMRRAPMTKICAAGATIPTSSTEICPVSNATSSSVGSSRAISLATGRLEPSL